MLSISQLTAMDQIVLPAPPSAIDRAVAAADAWFDTMRGPRGFGGPVAHWWQQSLLYTGAALDWRYEGIVAGYLHLWQNTADHAWLCKAQRAGDDLIEGQLPNGHFPASTFEINPATAGTPHEAACDVGLLLLARALRSDNQPSWRRYAGAAERNLRSFYLDQLWDAQAQAFRDSPHVPSFVPNKAATACDALFLLADLMQDGTWVERYALPTLNRIMQHQVRGGRLDGAIAQNSFGTHTIDKYLPIYIARCVPALLSGYAWTDDARYCDAALRAMQFVARWMDADGTVPTVVYANQRINRYPSWISPLGDVLRAADALGPHGFDVDLQAIQQRLLAGQDTSGGFQTATGFAAQAGGRVPTLPDVRDVLHVAGWCDKAFRYLAAHTGNSLPSATSATFAVECVFQKRTLQFLETPDVIEVADRDRVRFRWIKGAQWPEVATQEFWLR